MRPEKSVTHRAALGQALQHHPIRGRVARFWLRMGLGVGLLLLAFSSALWGVWHSVTTVAAHGRAVILRTLPGPTLLSILALLSGVCLIQHAIRHRHDGMTLYEHGFLLRRGTRQYIWDWDSLTACDTSIIQVPLATAILRTSIQLCLENSNGQRLTLSNRYHAMPDLVHQVRERAIPLIYTKLRNRLSQGEQVAFHPHLTATRQGFQLKQSFIAWELKPESVIKNRTFYLIDPSNRKILFKTRLRQIRNLDVLRALLAQPLLTQPHAQAGSLPPK